ncbi:MULTISPECIES: sulfurtransferase [unclassified Streptomyces]|uniref:sulfurtransferase n=1 Tax=unclassified Streptomyces TaxID=2593676 RepID=UPI001929869E|nr:MULTISPECIES: sulfurtransferase [unclassified Streptomyces]CAD5935962.1 Putative thiosulfate sulfurtransferase SseB [Streptomyces sp. KY70]CAD5987865.1 Putative thiosulfate sulfurtransferase SseB [Streptomyces sp. KY75]
MKPIITASEYASESAGPRPPVLLDVRWQLGGPHGRPDYEAGHLPGAVFVDLDTELAGPAGSGGRHPLPDPEAFGAVMRRAGVGQDTPVVVYDGGQGWAAARAWWLLRWTGHADVRVLDGGLAAWTGDLSTEIPEPAKGDFRPKPGALPTLDADAAAALARTGLLLDARAAERYRGDVEPIDRVGGHIPGAVSAPTTANVAEDGRYLPAERLTERFTALGAGKGDGPVGVYCGSGVSGAHEVLALEIAGIRAALYPGSWSEWSADPARPVATGPEPA